MLPSDGGVMAHTALEVLPAGSVDTEPAFRGFNQTNHVLGDSDVAIDGQNKDLKVTAEKNHRENGNPETRTDYFKVDSKSTKEKGDIYVSGNVVNRLSGSKKNKAHSNLDGAARKNISAGDDRKKQGSSKGREDSFVRENIAGNNAGIFTDDILMINYTGAQERGKAAIVYDCPTCGEMLDRPGVACKYCMQRSKHADPKNGTLDEILAYAQSFATSVKKMWNKKTYQKGHEASVGTDTVDKLHDDQAEMTTRQRGLPLCINSEDKHPRKIYEITTPAPSVCGDDLETMSNVDGENTKEQRGRLERQISVTSTDSRPPLMRAKTKVNAVVSSTRTKSYRAHIIRTRTGHELKSEALLPPSAKGEGRKGMFSEAPRKSGRTHTFDSCNLHARKDFSLRSNTEVMHEGTSVDPPSGDDKGLERTLKYAISRSATSPGTNAPVKKIQREPSNFGVHATSLIVNSKLPLRANKAAALRMDAIQKQNAMFHQQPAIDGGDASPVVERKRPSSRQLNEIKTGLKEIAEVTENLKDHEPCELPKERQLSQIREATSEELNIKEDTKELSPEVIYQPPVEETGSNIYCGTKDYITQSNSGEVFGDEESQVPPEISNYDKEVAGPYCGVLHYFGDGVDKELVKSTTAPSSYFEKADDEGQEKVAVEDKPEGDDFYTDTVTKPRQNQISHVKQNDEEWYSQEVKVKGTSYVRGSISDVVTTRSNVFGSSSSHQSRKQTKYCETDVDSGTIYHMPRRIASDQKVSSNSEFCATVNFFDIGDDVSKSSSSTSENVSPDPECEYTGGFLESAFQNEDKKDVIDNTSSYSFLTYTDHERSDSKPEPLECDVYTGSVFHATTNNMELASIRENWKNISTNNSNRLPYYRNRSRTAWTRNRRVLNCSNNSNSRSQSSTKISPTIIESNTPSLLENTTYCRPRIQPVNLSFDGTIDFTKYDNIGMDDNSLFSCSTSKYERIDIKRESPRRVITKTEDLYTPGDRHTNLNNNNEFNVLNCNNNHFGDFYTGDETPNYGSTRETRSNSTTAPSNKPANPSFKYAPGNFYENAYPESQCSSPPAQTSGGMFFGMFNRNYEEPATRQAQTMQPQYSPEYAGAFPFGSMIEEKRHKSHESSVYEGYGSSPTKHSAYDNDGYFDYCSPSSRDEMKRDKSSGDRPLSPAEPKIKRVGAIICRDNVANKDDYAEDVNRDLMEDPWIPISYRLAAEQVKEMGGGRCSSKELFRPTDAKPDPAFMDASPFAQGQMLEALGRKNNTWNLKQNSDSLKEDFNMVWRDAREAKYRNNRAQRSHQTSQQKSRTPESITRSNGNSVWRPSDQIPAKARGNRTIRTERSSQIDKDTSNSNNSSSNNSEGPHLQSGETAEPGMAKKGGGPKLTSGAAGRRGDRMSKSDSGRESKVTSTSNPDHKRAHFPTKVVIDYPELKMKKRPPSPDLPLPTPPFTTTVMRGQDVLYITLCKKPNDCIRDPDKIDTTENPFGQVKIEIPKNEELEAKVEAERRRSRKHPTPLNCFSPPKWVLLEDKEVANAKAVSFGADMGKSKRADNKTTVKTVSRSKGKDRQTTNECPPTESLASEFGSYIEDLEKWPNIKHPINDQNRETYNILSDQLKDARSLMEMPVRKREERLWHLPTINAHHGNIHEEDEAALKVKKTEKESGEKQILNS